MAGASVSAIAPAVEWLANTKLQMAMPPQVVLLVASALVWFGHVLSILALDLYSRLPTPRVAVTQPISFKVTTQAGFARIYTLLALALLSGAVLLLNGCAGITSVASGYNQTAITDFRAAEDLRLQIAVEQFCTMSVDAMNRHAEYINGVNALCVTKSAMTAAQITETISGNAALSAQITAIAASLPQTATLAPVVQVPEVVPSAASTPTPAPVAKAKRRTVPIAPVTPPPASTPSAIVAPTPVPVMPPAAPAPTLLSPPVIPK
jgi:hypothetical protein